jgi:TPR repeat protein
VFFHKIMYSFKNCDDFDLNILGDPAAMYNLSIWLVHGKHGLQKDPKRALQLTMESAKHNFPREFLLFSDSVMSVHCNVICSR